MESSKWWFLIRSFPFIRTVLIRSFSIGIQFVYFLFCFAALTRPNFCAWCSIRPTFLILPNVGLCITDGQLDAWKSSLFRVIVKKSSGWNIPLCVTGTIPWFPSHRLVCVSIMKSGVPQQLVFVHKRTMLALILKLLRHPWKWKQKLCHSNYVRTFRWAVGLARFTRKCTTISNNVVHVFKVKFLTIAIVLLPWSST